MNRWVFHCLGCLVIFFHLTTGTAGCAEEDDFDPSSVTCSDQFAAAVIRLDFFSLKPKGYALFVNDGASVTIAEAAEIAAAAPHDTDANNHFELQDGSPTDEDIVALFAEPGDFGAKAIVDLRTGALLFKAGVVWMGEGEIYVPTSWQEAAGLGRVSSNAPQPVVLDAVPASNLGSYCYTIRDNTDVEVSCTTGADALAAVRGTRLAHEIAACGAYRAAAVFWARTVGMTDYDTAEWLVVLTGVAPVQD